MPVIYDIGTRLYHLGIRAAAPFDPKAERWVQGRRGVWERLKEKAPGLQGCLWMHCSSLGEFEQGRPVLEELKRRRPGMPVLLTFYSPSGYEVMKHDPVATHVEYLPPDGHSNAEELIRLINPGAALFVKYEFWYHYLDQLQLAQVPTFLISARFRPEQPFFKWYGATHKAMLRCFTHIFVQDARSRDLLGSIGIGNTTIGGDPRFDRVMQILERDEQMPLAQTFREQVQGPLLICGSTWPGDEEVLLPALASLKEAPALILAPHELEAGRVDALAAKLPAPVSCWSSGRIVSGSRTLLMDQVGPLARTYRYGDVAYVGGGFVDGIHNLLEAAVWGVPVIFGPNHQKFTEAKGLIDAGGGFSIRTAGELSQVLEQLLNDIEFRIDASRAAAAYVRRNLGSSTATSEALLKLF